MWCSVSAVSTRSHVACSSPFGKQRTQAAPYPVTVPSEKGRGIRIKQKPFFFFLVKYLNVRSQEQPLGENTVPPGWADFVDCHFLLGSTVALELKNQKTRPTGPPPKVYFSHVTRRSWQQSRAVPRGLGLFLSLLLCCVRCCPCVGGS